MRSEFADATARLLWSQWTALGVAGTAALPDHAIDLEALISLTPMLRYEDPRLYDEALDWCVSHSQHLLATGRLRRLQSELPEPARNACEEFAANVNATAHPKPPWPTRRTGEMVRTSGKSRPPDVRLRPLLALRLRCLFGVTARADVILQFLRPGMTREGSPSLAVAVSELTDLGYSKPALGEVLGDLAKAGLLERFRRGNRDHYQLELPQAYALKDLLGGALPAAAPNWAVRFRIVAGLLAKEAETREKKPAVQAVAIIKELDRHRDALERLCLKAPERPSGWRELTKWAEQTLLAGDPSRG